jgi:hypothetical protein
MRRKGEAKGGVVERNTGTERRSEVGQSHLTNLTILSAIDPCCVRSCWFTAALEDRGTKRVREEEGEGGCEREGKGEGRGKGREREGGREGRRKRKVSQQTNKDDDNRMM